MPSYRISATGAIHLPDGMQRWFCEIMMMRSVLLNTLQFSSLCIDSQIDFIHRQIDIHRQKLQQFVYIDRYIYTQIETQQFVQINRYIYTEINRQTVRQFLLIDRGALNLGGPILTLWGTRRAPLTLRGWVRVGVFKAQQAEHGIAL